ESSWSCRVRWRRTLWLPNGRWLYEIVSDLSCLCRCRCFATPKSTRLRETTRQPLRRMRLSAKQARGATSCPLWDPLLPCPQSRAAAVGAARSIRASRAASTWATAVSSCAHRQPPWPPMEEKLAAAFTVIATSQDVSPQCHKYAIPSLCFFAFPPCEPGAPGGRAPEPRSVCRDECELLEHSLCRMEYSIAKRHPLIGQQKILPVCEELAPVGSPESESCLRLGVPHREAEDVNKGGRGRSFSVQSVEATCGVFERVCPLWVRAPKPD
ncbi:hypothetical protein HPB47_021989, partial [Ixodes persulcatus]